MEKRKIIFGSAILLLLIIGVGFFFYSSTAPAVEEKKPTTPAPPVSPGVYTPVPTPANPDFTPLVLASVVDAPASIASNQNSAPGSMVLKALETLQGFGFISSSVNLSAINFSGVNMSSIESVLLFLQAQGYISKGFDINSLIKFL